MHAEVANVSHNMTQAEQLVEEAFTKGAEWVVLPEFFPSAMAFVPDMLRVAMPLAGPAQDLLVRAARKHRGYVGGSFISIDEEDHTRRHNTFILAGPDGVCGIHQKDIPTWWENGYYLGGNDNGVVIDHGEYRVGSVLCWEFTRWRTAERLLGKVDFVLGSSCWWGMSETPIFKKLGQKIQQHEFNTIYKIAMGRMARLLGVPVVHAAHAEPFRGKTPLIPLPYISILQGESQITDAYGNIVARRSFEEGAGVITAEIEPVAVPPSKPLGNGFWIEIKPLPFLAAWELAWLVFNAYGKLYYKRMVAKGIY
jgi:predicted amidohydrolase